MYSWKPGPNPSGPAALLRQPHPVLARSNGKACPRPHNAASDATRRGSSTASLRNRSELRLFDSGTTTTVDRPGSAASDRPGIRRSGRAGPRHRREWPGRRTRDRTRRRPRRRQDREPTNTTSEHPAVPRARCRTPTPPDHPRAEHRRDARLPLQSSRTAQPQKSRVAHHSVSTRRLCRATAMANTHHGCAGQFWRRLSVNRSAWRPRPARAISGARAPSISALTNAAVRDGLCRDPKTFGATSRPCAAVSSMRSPHPGRRAEEAHTTCSTSPLRSPRSR